VLTKRIKQIESKLQETGAIPASQVKVIEQHQGGTVRPTRKTGKFDKQLIIEKAATATDAKHLAKACGYELDGNLRRRISWLVKHDKVLDAKFLSVKPRPAKKQ
jgi:hypothetical protein